jgi:tricorn protease
VTDRAELSDVLAQMVSELSTLHSQVGSNDVRRGADDISVATLGAEFERTEKGYRVTTLFMGDPELPDQRSPLALPHVAVRVGDTLVAVNGQSLTAGSRPLAERLRNKAGRQTLLSVVTAEGATRSVVVTPITARADGGLRYAHWEHENRRKVDVVSQSRIGYLHLQSMVATDMAHFAREFYPVFQREGLILDLRDNSGGNIDSWIIETLQRRAWMFWQARNADAPYPNQQLAFRGHVVALIDGRTYSDGETLSEGLKRNKLATLIGMRTAGAGIWLSDGNRLKDGGIARAAESGQFAETNGSSVWLVEGIGVTPDIVVDNLPHAAYKGRDAQLEAAIEFLKKKMVAEPIVTPKLPAF